jgi:hypothetical protein
MAPPLAKNKQTEPTAQKPQTFRAHHPAHVTITNFITRLYEEQSRHGLLDHQAHIKMGIQPSEPSQLKVHLSAVSMARPAQAF